MHVQLGGDFFLKLTCDLIVGGFLRTSLTGSFQEHIKHQPFGITQTHLVAESYASKNIVHFIYKEFSLYA